MKPYTLSPAEQVAPDVSARLLSHAQPLPTADQVAAREAECAAVASVLREAIQLLQPWHAKAISLRRASALRIQDACTSLLRGTQGGWAPSDQDRAASLLSLARLHAPN